MTDQEHHWSAFAGGETIGGAGSESGVILEDEKYAGGARITLERDGSVAPFAITCGRYGLMLHTRFFDSEDEARHEYAEMKVELGRMVEISSDTSVSDDQIAGMEMRAAVRFVERFPT